MTEKKTRKKKEEPFFDTEGDEIYIYNKKNYPFTQKELKLLSDNYCNTLCRNSANKVAVKLNIDNKGVQAKTSHCFQQCINNKESLELFKRKKEEEEKIVWRQAKKELENQIKELSWKFGADEHTLHEAVIWAPKNDATKDEAKKKFDRFKQEKKNLEENFENKLKKEIKKIKERMMAEAKKAKEIQKKRELVKKKIKYQKLWKKGISKVRKSSRVIQNIDDAVEERKIKKRREKKEERHRRRQQKKLARQRKQQEYDAQKKKEREKKDEENKRRWGEHEKKIVAQRNVWKRTHKARRFRNKTKAFLKSQGRRAKRELVDLPYNVLVGLPMRAVGDEKHKRMRKKDRRRRREKRRQEAETYDKHDFKQWLKTQRTSGGRKKTKKAKRRGGFKSKRRKRRRRSKYKTRCRHYRR